MMWPSFLLLDYGLDLQVTLLAYLIPSLPSLYFHSSLLSLTSCSPSVLAVDAPQLFTRDASKRLCNPWPLKSPLDSSGNALLVPLVHRMFMYSNSYILNHTGLRDYLASSNIVVRYVRDKAPSSVNDVASWTRIQLGTSPSAAFFATTLVYCECLDLLLEKHAIYDDMDRGPPGEQQGRTRNLCSCSLDSSLAGPCLPSYNIDNRVIYPLLLLIFTSD